MATKVVTATSTKLCSLKFLTEITAAQGSVSLFRPLLHFLPNLARAGLDS